MLRARMSNGLFIFGLDAENIRRLKAGMPIHVELDSMGGQDRFVLIYGDTLDDVKKELEKTLGISLD